MKLYNRLRISLIALRVAIALVFLAHALVRVLSIGSMATFSGFLHKQGLIFGNLLVWGLTVFEIAGGLLLALGSFTRWLAAGFIIILLMGIVLIHLQRGWFVGEHGTGGMEYSFILIVALLVVMAADPFIKTKDIVRLS